MLTPINSGQIQTRQIERVEPTPVDATGRRLARKHRLGQDIGIPKVLYQHITRLVSNFLSQIMGRGQDEQQQRSLPNKQRQSLAGNAAANDDNTLTVRGIADRMPRLVDPENPFPNRDLILLGEARDFPEPVIAIQYGDYIKPVFYEGNQVVARGLYLDCTQSSMDGQLVLADGSRLPVLIKIITAV
ncbi:MAG: hypothetical protein R3E89_09825 [Thiolinea sp.]